MPSIKQIGRAIRNLSRIDPNSLSRIADVLSSLRALERGQVLISGHVLDPENYPTCSVIDGKLVFEYTYTPAVRDLKKGGAGNRLMEMLNKRADVYRIHLSGIVELSDWLNKIPSHGSPDVAEPYWENSWFEGLDGASLYYFLVKNNPSTYMEIGSGNSTKFARKAINDHCLKTKIISIDPQPRADIDKICDHVIRQKCEDVDLDVFANLESTDVLFIDNSHRSFQGSDVTVFFTEILPTLPKGVLFGLHDIFLPFDYPPTWADRFYNEQYLLMAYLHGGMGGGSIEFPVRHVNASGDAEKMLAPSLLDHICPNGGAFWMRR